jgi:hypothetical protein
MLHARMPVISDDRMIQVAAVEEAAGSSTFHVIDWRPDHATSPGGYRATAEVGEQSMPVTVEKVEAAELPAPVRRELIYAGYGKPPLTVNWLVLTTGAPTGGKRPLTLRITHGDGSGALNSTVTLQSPASSD